MKRFYQINFALLLVALLASATPGFATTHTIQVGSGGNNFSPTSLSVTVGDTIKWVWAGGTHSVVGTSVPNGAATISSGPATSTVGATYSYKVTVAGTYNYDCGVHGVSMSGSFTATGTAVSGPISESGLSLFPNPASEAVVLEFTLKAPAKVSVDLLNSLGQKTTLRQPESLAGGQQRLLLSLTDHSLAPGLYFLRLQAGEQSRVQRLVVK